MCNVIVYSVIKHWSTEGGNKQIIILLLYTEEKLFYMEKARDDVKAPD